VPAGDVERFGDFARGPVLLTVRGSEGAALHAESTLDLAACGLGDESWAVVSRDRLNDLPIAAERLGDPPRLRWTVVLDAEEVGVYAFAAAPAEPGDLDLDGDVDLDDYTDWVDCLAGPLVGFRTDADEDLRRHAPPVQRVAAPENRLLPDCEAADLDSDGDVDLADFAAFELAFTD
jgi:hypothetical protein